MSLMEKIGWWFLRRAKPHRRLLYSCICPYCKIHILQTAENIIKNEGKHTCGKDLEIIILGNYGST